MINILLLTSTISFVPAFFSVKKVYRKIDLNFFDFLLLFHTLHFSIIPFKSVVTGEFRYANDLDASDILNTFVYYICFAFLLLFVDVYWTYKKQQTNVLNITAYINKTPPLFFSKKVFVLIIVCIILSAAFYLPHASTAIRNELDTGEKNVWAIYWGAVFTWINALVVLYFCWNIKKKRINLKSIFLFLIVVFLCAFASRRDLLELILTFLLFFYSLCRKYITFKTVSFFCIIILLIYIFYFPFYNVIRWNSVKFNPTSPVESFIQIIDYGIENWGTESKNAAQITTSRELGLYSAVAHIIKNDNNFQYGKLTFLAVDNAIPSIINPNKGLGTEEFLEKQSRALTDTADSVLYLSYGEFSFIGFIYVVFIFYFLGVIYQIIGSFFFRKTKSHLYGILIVVTLFSIAWNVELKLDALFSNLFSSIVYFVILFVLRMHKYFKI